MTIPWVVAGPRIRPGHEITAPVSLLNTAPMLATLLNIPLHKEWEGDVVEGVWVKSVLLMLVQRSRLAGKLDIPWMGG